MDRETFDKMYRSHILYLTGESDGENPLEGNFSGLDFTGINIDGLNISNADFSNADFTGVSMKCCIFHDCNFNGARFKDTVASCTEFDGSSFRYSSIKSCTMNACSFDSCNFIKTFAGNTDFSRSVFVGSIFEGCVFMCSSFLESILSDTFFRGMRNIFKFCNFYQIKSKGLTGLKSIVVYQCNFDGGKTTNSVRRLNQKEFFLKYAIVQMAYNIKSFFKRGKRLQQNNVKMIAENNKEV